jgi:hypothetical protein
VSEVTGIRIVTAKNLTSETKTLSTGASPGRPNQNTPEHVTKT